VAGATNDIAGVAAVPGDGALRPSDPEPVQGGVSCSVREVPMPRERTGSFASALGLLGVVSWRWRRRRSRVAGSRGAGGAEDPGGAGASRNGVS
jgi:hypothetical protein